MQRRQITLEDGRYLIFYTFDEETTTAAAASSDSVGEANDYSAPAGRHAKPRADAQATEERLV